MLFSSISFIYYFLPVVLIIYFILPNKFKNMVLLLFSLFFYFYGEGIYVVLLLLSCFVNYIIGIIIDKNEGAKRKLYLIVGLIFDISLLLYFKYTNFFIDNVNNLLGTKIIIKKIIMPLGISFFTFQTISYLIDVYKKEVKADHNFIDLSCYITLFPQLVAGPIVRYQTIKEELKKKEISYDNFAYGIERLVFGLSKKVILANNFGVLVNLLNETNGSILSSWLIAVAYTLQIYFDFSGYSDMAIGLGRIFGFKFLENFNYPYIAKSITDFWRRWHISLSSFFRDYVYFPLGGNRCSKFKWLRNIIIVWMLTGFWHGAAWNFILWGLFFAVVLLIEKLTFGKWLENRKIINHIYVIVVVVLSFTIFNANSFSEVVNSMKNMFGFNNLPFINVEFIYYFKSYLILIILGIVFSTPLINQLYEKLKKKPFFNYFSILIIFILLIIVTAYLVDSSFNPFLYFRF